MKLIFFFNTWKKNMIFKLELSPQNFHYDVLYPLYSGIASSGSRASSGAPHIKVYRVTTLARYTYTHVQKQLCYKKA